MLTATDQLCEFLRLQVTAIIAFIKSLCGSGIVRFCPVLQAATATTATTATATITMTPTTTTMTTTSTTTATTTKATTTTTKIKHDHVRAGFVLLLLLLRLGLRLTTVPCVSGCSWIGVWCCFLFPLWHVYAYARVFVISAMAAFAICCLML